MQIGSLIRRAARHHGDAACVTEGEKTLSFREFDAATDRLGNALLASGLKPGDRVGVLLPNGADCLVAYYALAKAGLVRLGLNTRETIENHEYKLAEADASAVIHDGAERFGLTVEIDRPRMRDLVENGNDAPCAIDRPLDAPFRIGFTGGTTGRPKGVVLTTRGELSEISAFLTDLIPDIGADDIFLHAAPIAHASGAFFLPAIERGAHSVIMPSFDAENFLALAKQSRASLTFLVPTMLAMIMDAPTMADADLSFRRIAYGASPISSRLLERAEARFGPIFAQTYGQAESPMVITCLKPEDHDRVGSCGRPFTIAEVAVVDQEENFLPPNAPGEIVTRGPQTMAGYWNRPEATAKAFRNGWLHTGDLGTMDEDGFFYILDRKDDMLISGGFNVYPREVEEILMGCDGVREAAVVGLPDEIWGDRVHAVVTGHSDLCSQQVMAHAKGHLANYKRPKDVEIWPELPKSAANKILRRSVREQILKGEPS